MHQDHGLVETADWFVSYNKADLRWAEWVAWQLEEAGDRVIVQEWDFRPGSNFVLEMHRAASLAKRTIAILSPDYLEAQFPKPEWAAAFSQDPTGLSGKLLPVRVRECELEGLLRSVIHIDLVEKNEEAAKEALLRGISRDRAKPLAPPLFPGSVKHTNSKTAVFPGAPSAAMQNLWNFAKSSELAGFGPPIRDIAQSDFYNTVREKRATILQISSQGISAFPKELRSYFWNSYNDRILLGFLHRKFILNPEVFKKKHLESHANIEHKSRDGYYLFIDGQLIDFHTGLPDPKPSQETIDGMLKIDPKLTNALAVGTVVALAISDDPIGNALKIGNGFLKGIESTVLKSIIEQFENHIIKSGIH